MPSSARNAGNAGTARAAQFVVVLAFVGSIAAACLRGFVFPPGASSIAREFRAPAPRPMRPLRGADWLQYPRAFDAWWSDAFGLRPTLIRWHNAVKLLGFGVSPTPELFVGPNQNLFTTTHDSLGVYRGTKPMSARELWVWRHVLNARRQWCQERNIAFVYAIAPNKETVYPERVAARLDRVGPTRLDQLSQYMHSQGDDWWLDLSETMQRAKRECASEGEVYYRLGTHWNERGVLYAYRALIDAVAQQLPGVRAQPREKFTLKESANQGDSWAGRLYLEDVLKQEGLELSFDGHTQLQQLNPEQPQHTFAERPDSGLPRAVVVHDSFGELLRPILAEHFSRTTFLWSANFDPVLIERERPDVVIHLQVERALAGFLPSLSPLDTPARLEREFEQSTTVLVDSRELERFEVDGGLTAVKRPDRSWDLVVDSEAHLLVPAFDVPRTGWVVFKIVIECPEPSEFVLEFLTLDQREYFKKKDPRAWSKQGRSWRKPVTSGPNTLWIKLLVPDLWGPLRVDPSRVLGAYRLVILEGRAVPQ